MVTEVTALNASAAFYLAGTCSWVAGSGHLDQMPWRQSSIRSPFSATTRQLPTRPAPGDHPDKRRAVGEPVDMGYVEFGGAA